MAITIYSSHGHAIFGASGELIEDYLELSEYPAQNHPVRLNVEEWRTQYPNENPDGRGWDILDWGFWTKNGDYVQPVQTWRDEAKKANP
jgi:hypothetical protein